MLAIQHVYKSYGSLNANIDIDFSIQKGKMVGLIGPDGAGKTTLMRMICSLMIPDQGKIKVGAYDTISDRMKVRSIIGYMPQKFSLYPDLTVEQNINFFADLFDISKKERMARISELYKFSRLEPFKKRQAGALSGGMKQKLALSCNLIHSPDVLILDEPTYGVDPLSRQEFWEIVRTIKNMGTTILVSTPYMDEAEHFDSLLLMFNGKIINRGLLNDILKVFPYHLYSVIFNKSSNHESLKITNNAIKSVHIFGDRTHISFNNQVSDQQWTSWLQAGLIKEYQIESPSLEDVFLYYIGAEHE